MKKRRLKRECRTSNRSCNFYGGGGSIYFFGLIGSLIYNIQNANSLGAGILGVLKAIVWPTILVYKLTGFLG